MSNVIPSLIRPPTNIPLEYVSFDAELINELQQLEILKPNKKCVHISRVNKHLEEILRDRVKRDVKEAFFQYGQILFLNRQYTNAMYYFDYGASHFKDLQCTYQMGIIYYDGLECAPDPELACGYMKEILSKKELPEVRHLIYAASYNLGRAYYMGFGVQQSFKKALECWLFAADDGSPLASVHAQTMLGFYYSTEDHLDLAKALFWHSEACSNGSLQSQAVLGVMYFLGIGKNVDLGAALTCLRHASERGELYARGMLCYYYYSRKLFTNAANLACSMILSAPDMERANDSSRKGLAIAYFIYGRCLTFGLGVKKNICLSQIFNKKSNSWNADVTVYFRRMVGSGDI